MKRLLLLTFFSSMLIGQLYGQINVTFELNTATIENIDPSGIYVAGGSGFGVPGDNLMEDPDGDGIYTVTLQREAGFSSHYTFLNGNCGDWSCKENIAGLPCSDPANFNDRFLPELTEDVTIKACFGNCADDGTCESVLDSIAITFELNTSLIEVSDEGVFVAGGGSFGSPGDNPLTDPDGDGIYSTTLLRPAGFSGFYTFTNGACPDFSCKENLAGLPCGDPANFNDRFIDSAMEDIVIQACFGTCDDDGSCTIVSDSIEITFMLNTETIEVDPTGIFIAGGGNFGVPGDNPMIDPDGDGIYTFTSTRPVGFTSHYTFVNGNCPDWSCKEDISGLPCADPNAFNDRFLDGIMESTSILACFGNCVSDGSCALVGVNELQLDETLFSLVPTIAQGFTEIRFGDSARGVQKNITVTSISGQLVHTSTENSDDIVTLNTETYLPGVYFTSVRTENAVYTRKFIVQ